VEDIDHWVNVLVENSASIIVYRCFHRNIIDGSDIIVIEESKMH
jgi:hypothetical protein